MGFDTIIVNGRIVTATDTSLADVAIADGKIALIGKDLPRDNATRLIDAGGKYVLPGGIDVHTHLDMPFGGTTSADDFETGTRAAAFGGTTTLIDFAIQYKGQTLRTAFDTWMQKAPSKAVCDYAFHCIITDLRGAQLDEMNALVREGVTSFKLFMAYPGVFMLDDASIFKALRTTAKNGGLVCMHAENGSAIDVIVQQALAEGKRRRSIMPSLGLRRPKPKLPPRHRARRDGGRPVYIVHLSCNEALEKIREARDRGLPVYAETCPQYLYLSLENMDAPGFEGAKYVFTPPLREKWHQEKLWNGLKAATTCRSFRPITVRFASRSRKNLARTTSRKFPNGGPGIEHRMSLIYSGGVAKGRFNVNRFVELVSTTPAKLFGLYPRKGTIAVGSDADLVIFDPERKHTISAKTHHMRVDYSMFEGIQVTGMPDVVLSRGRVIVEGDNFLGRAGQGEFLKRSTYAVP